MFYCPDCEEMVEPYEERGNLMNDESVVSKIPVNYSVRWHMLSYVDLRLAPDMDVVSIEALRSNLIGRPETTMFQVDRVNNGQQNCWIVVIGTRNSRTTEKRIREFFLDRRIKWREEFLGDKSFPLID